MAMMSFPLAQVAVASCLLILLSPLTAAYDYQTGANNEEIQSWLESWIQLYQPTSAEVGQQQQQQTHYFTQDQVNYIKNLLNTMKLESVNDDMKQEIVEHFFPKGSEENVTQQEPQTTTPADSDEQSKESKEDSEEQTTVQEQQTTTPADSGEQQVKQEPYATVPPSDSEEQTTQEQQTTTPGNSGEQVKQEPYTIAPVDSEEQTTQEPQTTTPADSNEQSKESKEDSEEQTTVQEQQTTTPADSVEQVNEDSEEQTTQLEAQTTTPANSEEQVKEDSEEQTTEQVQQTTTPADSEEQVTQEPYTIAPADSKEQTTQEQQTTTPSDSEEQTTQEQQTTTPSDSEEQTTQEQQTTTPSDSEEQTTQEQQTTTPAESDEQVKEDSDEQTTQQESQTTTPAVSEEDSEEQKKDSEEQKEHSEEDDDSHEDSTEATTSTTTPSTTTETTTTTTVTTTTEVTTTPEATTTTTTTQPEPDTTTTTTTTTTAESTSTVTPSLELCNNCVVHHGVGYAVFPGYCDAYIQCRFYGAVPTAVFVRRCPSGQYWNQDKLTCDFEANVKCTPVNNCPNHKAIPGDWAAYLIYDGQNWTRESCPAGRTYNTVTCGCTDKHGDDDGNHQNCSDKKAITGDKTGFMQFTGNGWVRMPCPATVGYSELTCSCTDKLAAETPTSICPYSKPIPGDRSGFLQFTGVSWIPRPCPATLVYNPYTCVCTYDQTNEVDDGKNKHDTLCKATVALNFDSNDETDSSPNHFWVNNTGVTFNGGKAFFNGKSRLTIPGLSNMEFGSTVYVLIKYKHSSANSKQTLVANGDCQVRQSLAVCSGKDSVDFYAETKEQISLGKITVPSDVGAWQFAVYALDNGSLTGSVGANKVTQPVKGALDRRQRGLVIGGGGDCDNFHGIIDEVQVFLCKPSL